MRPQVASNFEYGYETSFSGIAAQGADVSFAVRQANEPNDVKPVFAPAFTPN